MLWLARILSKAIVIKALVARRGSSASARGARPTASGAAPPRGDADGRVSGRPQARAGDDGIPPQTGEGLSPGSPFDMPARDWKSSGKRTLKEIKADRVPLVAAGMTYYFFLAIFPAFIAALGLMRLLNADTSGVEDFVQSALPKGAGDMFVEAIRNAEDPSQSSSLVAAFAGIALALWSASSGMVALQSGLNVAYDIKEDRRFIAKRGIALVLLVLTLLLGGVPSPLFTFGESTVFVVSGWVLTAAAVLTLFALFYYLGPKRPSPRWLWVTPGGLIGAVMWIVASAAFYFYVSEFNSYGKTYGKVSGVIVMLLWLYLTSMSILVGGELNAESERQASMSTAASRA